MANKRTSKPKSRRRRHEEIEFEVFQAMKRGEPSAIMEFLVRRGKKRGYERVRLAERMASRGATRNRSQKLFGPSEQYKFLRNEPKHLFISQGQPGAASTDSDSDLESR